MDPPCAECAALIRRVHARLDACPHGDAKPSCTRCDCYCYDAQEQSAVREVMRAGARRFGLLRPVLFGLKLLDAVRSWRDQPSG